MDFFSISIIWSHPTSICSQLSLRISQTIIYWTNIGIIDLNLFVICYMQSRDTIWHHLENFFFLHSIFVYTKRQIILSLANSYSHNKLLTSMYIKCYVNYVLLVGQLFISIEIDCRTSNEQRRIADIVANLWRHTTTHGCYVKCLTRTAARTALHKTQS